jgi:hypothetical protein
MPQPMSDEERAEVLAKLHRPGASQGQIRAAQNRIAEDNKLRNRLDLQQEKEQE